MSRAGHFGAVRERPQQAFGNHISAALLCKSEDRIGAKIQCNSNDRTHQRKLARTANANAWRFSF